MAINLYSLKQEPYSEDILLFKRRAKESSRSRLNYVEMMLFLLTLSVLREKLLFSQWSLVAVPVFFFYYYLNTKAAYDFYIS